VAALDDPVTVRAVLAVCARRLDGKSAAATTARRKRAVFANALGYAVEFRLLAASPLDRIQWKAAEVAETVDRRSVASPAQARGLLAAVRAQGPRGERQEAFFGCLYYAAMRPSEAVALREADCVLPPAGWGMIDLAASEPWAGTESTPRHRPRGTRAQAPRRHRDPQHPHPARPGRDAPRPHRPVRHRPRRAAVPHRPRRALNDTGYGQVWQRARPNALTAAQQASPLARRPYDLRHAAVSLWLNSGVPATEVARRAGHGVAVLLKVYANCIDGQAATANQRISDALDQHDSDGPSSGVGVTLGARPLGQPLRIGPGVIRAGFHTSGQGLGEHERGCSLQCTAEQIGRTGRLESEGPPVLATCADLGQFHFAPRLLAQTRGARPDLSAGQ
jgi:integrase